MKWITAFAIVIVLSLGYAAHPANGQTVPPPAVLWLPLVQTEPGVCPCEADTLNCSDFSAQPQAQACFDYCMARTGIDIHRLDFNNNSVACEGGRRVYGYGREALN